MSYPRGDRWLSLLQVGERMAQLGYQLPAGRASRRHSVRRRIRRLEQLYETRFCKRFCGRLYVSVRALQWLKPMADPSEESEESKVRTLEGDVAEHHVRLNAHAARIRQLENWRRLKEKHEAESVAQLQADAEELVALEAASRAQVTTLRPGRRAS